jgi:hypothetical protein
MRGKPTALWLPNPSRGLPLHQSNSTKINPSYPIKMLEYGSVSHSVLKCHAQARLRFKMADCALTLSSLYPSMATCWWKVVFLTRCWQRWIHWNGSCNLACVQHAPTWCEVIIWNVAHAIKILTYFSLDPGPLLSAFVQSQMVISRDKILDSYKTQDVLIPWSSYCYSRRLSYNTGACSQVLLVHTHCWLFL